MAICPPRAELRASGASDKRPDPALTNHIFLTITFWAMTFGREKTSFSAKQFPEERKQGWGDGHLLNHPVGLGVAGWGGCFFQNTHSGSLPPENEMQPRGWGLRRNKYTCFLKVVSENLSSILYVWPLCHLRVDNQWYCPTMLFYRWRNPDPERKCDWLSKVIQLTNSGARMRCKTVSQTSASSHILYNSTLTLLTITVITSSISISISIFPKHSTGPFTLNYLSKLQ